MIEFEQVGGESPKDVRVTTDDHNAELAVMTDAFADYESESDGGEPLQASVNLSEAEMGDDHKLTFVIPGAEVGEVADIIDDFTGVVPLNDWMELQNERVQAELEEKLEAKE